jgi:hypothetical protein
MDNLEIPHTPRRGWSIERYSAVFAVLVSLTTLAMLIAQTRLMQTQARASVWPHVSIGFSYAQTRFAWVVSNNGVGPAVIHSVHIQVDGKPQRDWVDVLSSLRINAKLSISQLSGTVLTPAENTNDRYEIMKMQAGNESGATAMAAAAMARVDVSLCYCSIYDDCWISGFVQGRESKREVSQCPEARAGDFSQ